MITNSLGNFAKLCMSIEFVEEFNYRLFLPVSVMTR